MRSQREMIPDNCETVVALAAEAEALLLKSGTAIANHFARSRVTLAQLVSALRCRHALTRIKALALLSYFDVNDALPLLISTLRGDPSPLVRHEAAYFLGATHAETAVEVLARALIQDRSELVRHEAAEALGEHGSERGAEWLERALHDTSALVAETAAVALDRLSARSKRG